MTKVILRRQKWHLLSSNTEDKEYIFSSELKGVPKDFKDVKEFPCGSILSIDYTNNIETSIDITNGIYKTVENKDYDFLTWYFKVK